MIHQFRVAVRVHDRHDGNVQLVRLGDRDVLTPWIDDEQRIRQPLHVADPLEVPDHLVPLTLKPEKLLLGQQAVLVGELLLRILETLHGSADGHEVGQGSAEPAMRDVELAAAPRLFLDRLLRLALGADEEQTPSHARHVLNVVRRLAEALQRLLEIDDVDAVSAAEDVAPHLRVPASRLVAEVHSGLQHLLHRDLSQDPAPAIAC